MNIAKERLAVTRRFLANGDPYTRLLYLSQMSKHIIAIAENVFGVISAVFRVLRKSTINFQQAIVVLLAQFRKKREL
jgi:uncharacterized membrane protein